MSKLLILSDRPELFESVELPDREVLRWLPEGVPPDGPAHWHAFTGDPLDPDSYDEILRDSPDAVALLDFADPERAAGAAEAMTRANSWIAILALCGEGRPPIPREYNARCVRWPDFLRVDLDAEIHRLETLRRVRRLRAFAEGARVLPILVQTDPDPDAMASALAVRVLLKRPAAEMPIVSLGEVTRPENRRMAALLKLQVTQVTEAELRAFDRIVVVDTQPYMLHGPEPRVAVIDHHPAAAGYYAEFADIRPDYGAASTMLTEYLRADNERRIRTRVATALLYGIKTDTASLGRGVTPADVTAYAFLQGLSDRSLLHRIERPGYDIAAVRSFGQALGSMALDGDLAVAFMSAMVADGTHILANLADFLVGMEGVRWSGAAARVDGEVMIKLRHVGADPGAGDLASALTREHGHGGGHSSMAQAVLPVDAIPDFDEDDPGAAAQTLLALIQPTIEAMEEAGRAEAAEGVELLAE